MQKEVMARAVAAVGLGLVAGAAQASGFQLQEQNASGLGNAYAGSAVVGENASTVYFNPAAMTRLEGSNVSTGLVLVKPSYKFKNDGSRNTPAYTGSDGGDAGSLFELPNLYVTSQIDGKWVAGIGMNSPFGLHTEYSGDWVGRFQSKVFDIETYNINPSLAYKANEKWSFGLGLNWQRMAAQYARAAATVNSAFQNTDIKLDVEGDAWGWNTGLTYKPSESTDIGFAYRSRVIHHLKGTLFSSTPAVAAGSAAKVDMALPDTFTLSVSQKLDERWTMLGDISRTNWSTLDKVLVKRGDNSVVQVLNANFRDTWRVALGGTCTLSDQWKWKYGVAYDQSPVRGEEERRVSLPDNNGYWYSTGAQWNPTKQSALDVGLTYIHIPKDRIHASTSTQGIVEGTYKGHIILLGVQYSARF
ncbi:OmpP1/FadL family transporter [Uliginosibacterium sp. 31-16]|uniref:OmpP1/FadL family transporter n=1 Tax=Uliginosibacterium sp. 31-16 TaxID=3068315 RepID=UPI00273E86AF|nr:OmpP1/FadL family transporter [Uliginosibacterium sp. 31-16]MDP5239877.1 OmpP1/FadL family transporter [Uliginosibacterium sp. 31-16]